MLARQPRLRLSLAFLAMALFLSALPARAFTIEASRVDVSVAPSFNHTPVRIPVTSGDPAFDVGSLTLSSDATWVAPSPDSATQELVLTFDTSGLVNQLYTATVTASLDGETVQLLVAASVSPLNIFKLEDDPTRSRMYGIQQNGLELGSVVVFNPLTGDHLGNVTVGRKPCDLAVTDDGLELLVINSVDETISVIDLAALALKDTILLPQFDNWGPDSTTANVGVGPGDIIYYTDGAWAPVLRVLDRSTLQVLQSNYIRPGSSYGFGDFATTGDRSLLFGWAQYGWSAGWAGSFISRFTIGADGTLAYTSSTNDVYPTVIGRDPLETPVLIPGDGQTVFVKQIAVDAATISTARQTFPNPVYSITPGGEIAATATALYETATGIKLADLPRSAPVQAISSDYSRLAYFDAAVREIRTVNLLDLIAPDVLGRQTVPADRAIVLPPPRLEWQPLPVVVGYRVYLGLSEEEVYAADPGSPLLLGEVSTPFFELGTSLSEGTRYYWRVDAVGPHDVVAGEVLEFLVSPISSSMSGISAATVSGHADRRTSFQLDSVAPGVPWHAEVDQPWATFSQADGTTPAVVELHLDASLLPAGPNAATVTISSGADRLFSLPVSLTVEPLRITHLRSDRSSTRVYGISENAADPSARAYLLEIDTLTEAIERVVDVGTSVTDLAVHPGDNRIYVPNWMPGRLLALDLDTLEQVRTYAFNPFGGTGYGTGDVYRVSAGGPGRLVVEEEDQWIDVSIFDTESGATLDTTFEREGGGAFGPSGRYYYHGDNNSSGAEIHKFDLVGDQFFELAHVRVASASYYGSRTVVVSEDGSRVFWNGTVFDPDLVEEWTFGQHVYSTSTDGRFAFAESTIYDIDRRAAAMGMPVATRVSAYNTVTGKLVVQQGASPSFFSLYARVAVAPSGPVPAGQTVAFATDAGGVDGTWDGTACAGSCVSDPLLRATRVVLTAILPPRTVVGSWGAGCASTTATTCTIDSLTADTTISPVILTAPEGLTASDGTHPGRVVVTWDDLTGEDGYRVYRSDRSGGGFLEIGTTEPDVTVFVDASPCDALRYYQVASYNHHGDSPRSVEDQGHSLRTNAPPEADAGGPYLGVLGEGVALDGSGSSDPDGSCGDRVISHAWDLNGDGSHGEVSGSNPLLTWHSVETLVCGGPGGCVPGLPYPISLQVADVLGATATATTTLTLYDNRPRAALSALPNPALCGGVVSFNASASSHGHPGHRIVSFQWDFDYDGTFAADASGTAAGHVYRRMGAHTAALRVTDDNNPPRTDIATAEVEVRIVNDAPTADAGGPYLVPMHQAVTLDASGSSDPDASCGDSLTYRWDLDGDGLYDDRTGEWPFLTWEDVSTLVCGGGCVPDVDYPVGVSVEDLSGDRDEARTTLAVSSVLFHDDFSDGNGQGDPHWSEASGNWAVDDFGTFYSSPRANNRALVDDVVGLGPVAAASIETSIKLSRRFKRSANGALLFGYRDGANYRYVRIVRAGRVGKLLIGQVGDPADALETGGIRARRRIRVRPNRWYRLRADVYPAGLVRVFLDQQEQPVLEHDFGNAVPGRIGYHASKAKTFFDDFSCWDELVLPENP